MSVSENTTADGCQDVTAMPEDQGQMPPDEEPEMDSPVTAAGIGPPQSLMGAGVPGPKMPPESNLMLTNEEIARRFNYHKPKGDQPARYESLRGALRTLAYRINEACPPSRELSLAFTHLEQVGFYANAAIARNE